MSEGMLDPVLHHRVAEGPSQAAAAGSWTNHAAQHHDWCMDCYSTQHSPTPWQHSLMQRLEDATSAHTAAAACHTTGTLTRMYTLTTQTKLEPAGPLHRGHTTLAAAAMHHCQCNLQHPKYRQGHLQHTLPSCPTCPAKHTLHPTQMLPRHAPHSPRGRPSTMHVHHHCQSAPARPLTQPPLLRLPQTPWHSP
jgi:hypothetical protein